MDSEIRQIPCHLEPIKHVPESQGQAGNADRVCEGTNMSIVNANWEK